MSVTEKDLVEAFERTGMSRSAAEAAARGRGYSGPRLAPRISPEARELRELRTQAERVHEEIKETGRQVSEYIELRERGGSIVPSQTSGSTGTGKTVDELEEALRLRFERLGLPPGQAAIAARGRP